MSSFTSPLDIRFLDLSLSEKPFMLLSEFTYYVGEEGSGHAIIVPKGYRTDFASVPRFLHRVVPPIGRHGKAAVIHDWLCDSRPEGMTSRRAADIMLEAMEVLGVKKSKRWVMYRGVRIGGPKF